MDAVYLYKQTSSDELDYSVALLQKFYPELRNIYIIGDNPLGIDNAVNVFYLGHRSILNKWADQLDKIRLAVSIQGLSEDFLLMNDDFFVTDIAKLGVYYNSDKRYLKDIVETRTKDQYRDSIETTIEYLVENDMSSTNYELHVPMVINKQLAFSLLANVPMGADLQFRSLYGNAYPAFTSGGMKDVKNIPIDDVYSTGLLSTSNVKFNSYRRALDRLL